MVFLLKGIKMRLPSQQENIFSRNNYYDNCKFLLILLVILAHMISPAREGLLTHNNFCNSICMLIHLFVMPSFLIISGYFSPTIIDQKHLKNLVSLVLVPYLVFEIFFKMTVPPKLDQADLFIESFYTLWFLAVLFLYRITVPFIKYLKLSPIMVALLLISFLSHLEIKWIMWGEWNFVKYAPYFLIGVWLRRKRIDISSYDASLSAKLLAAFAIFSVWLTIFFLQIDFQEVIPDSSYAGKTTGLMLLIRKYSSLDSIALDIIYRSVGLILAVCFFILFPKNKYIISKFGKNSLYPYLLHPVLMYFLEKTGFYGNETTIIFLGSLFLLSAIITVVLSTEIVGRCFNKFFRFIGDFLMRKKN